MIFHSITSAPPEATGIVEIPPCEALAPYVRCFWSFSGDKSKRVRIIPDCCADIIIELDSQNSGGFCGLSSGSFIAENNAAVFGIRFYAWGVRAFTRVCVRELFNAALPAQYIFDDFEKVESDIRLAPNTSERVRIAQKYLLERLKSDFNSDVMNSLFCALTRSCAVSVNDLSDYCVVGKRTLERAFDEYIGVSPKKMTDMLRYQLLWSECVKPAFDAMACVEKLGYYDEAHLYNDFKKYHGIGLPQARKEFLSLSQIYNTN